MQEYFYSFKVFVGDPDVKNCMNTQIWKRIYICFCEKLIFCLTCGEKASSNQMIDTQS